MRTLPIQIVVLALAQVNAPTLRTGDVARSLTVEDIARLEEMVGSKPWLVDGRRPIGPPATTQTITAYFAPITTTLTLRRGGCMTFSRETNPRPGPWTGMGSARPYVQVAIPGRPFEEILNDQDLNRPFSVVGSFQNEELIEVVTFIRSNPEAVGGNWAGAKVGTLPITSITRQPDGSVSVEWLFEPNQGQTAILEKRGANWAVISLRRFNRYV